MIKPLISIIMPVYNVELYIEAAIESILKQTYINIEFIIIDDGSTDRTWQIVERYSRIDDRIKSHRFFQNKKIVKALNFGLSISKGDFIARMDGDDISSIDRISKLYNFLFHNPDISLVGSFMEIIDESGQVIGKSDLIEDYSFLLKVIKFASPVPHIWMCKKSVYDVVGDYRLPGAEDYDFLLRMISKNLKFVNIPDYLYQVRVRDGNTSTSIGFIQFYHARLAYKLFVERDKFKMEETEWNNIGITSKSNKKIEIVNKAFNFLRISLLRFKDKQILFSFYYLAIAIILSPKTILYVMYQRVCYHILQKKYKK